MTSAPIDRIGGPASRAGAWMFAPAPAERLAMLRILVGTFAVVYLAVRLPAFNALADADPARFDPVGALAWMSEPVPDALLVTLGYIAIALGVAYAAGAAFRWTGPAFALVLLALTTYRSSWGQLLHFENLMVLHVLIVGLSRHSADGLSWDARHRRRKDPASSRAAANGPGGSPPAASGPVGPEPTGDGTAYGWPVRLAALVTVVTYVLAGVAKLRLGGLGWMLGDTLRNHVAYSAARLQRLGGSPSPLARELVAHGWVFPPLAVASVLVELLAPVALLGGRVRNLWVIAAWVLHAGIAALMFVVFPYPLFLVAFAPFYRLERLPRLLVRTPAAPSPTLRP